ncbi:hypothetical protein GLYMA_06G200166v4 [Glycine max]|nr:hypothetical protein GLYMA_06G200166v4 [Glycine max]
MFFLLLLGCFSIDYSWKNMIYPCLQIHVLSLVRPHQKLPHLFYHLEAPAHHVGDNKQIFKIQIFVY